MALVRSSAGDKMGRNLPFTALSPIVERRGKPRPRTPLMLSVKCTVEAFAKPNSKHVSNCCGSHDICWGCMLRKYIAAQQTAANRVPLNIVCDIREGALQEYPPYHPQQHVRHPALCAKQ